MNILILSWRGPGHPNAGGAEISTHEHAKGWVKAGHSVTLFTSYYEGAKREEIVDGVSVLRKGRQFIGVQWEAFKWYLFKDHPKYDLVIDQFHGIPFFTPLYIRGKKLAFIHEVTKEVWGLNPWSWPFNLIPTAVGFIFEPLIFILFYGNIPFMTVSDSTKSDLIKWGIPRGSITVIHNGVDLPKNKRSFQKEKKKTLIFLGALSKDKGIEDVLKTFSILDKNDPNFQFWIVGKGESHYLEKLKKQTIKLKLNRKIKFLGFISSSKKFELLAKAHLLINPSVREGWGLVVIEAASVGTPAVGYNVSGLKDSIVNGKTGVLSAKDPGSLAAAVLELMNNTDKYNMFRKNCLLWSNKFDWLTSVNESLKLVGKVFESS